MRKYTNMSVEGILNLCFYLLLSIFNNHVYGMIEAKEIQTTES